MIKKTLFRSALLCLLLSIYFVPSTGAEFYDNKGISSNTVGAGYWVEPCLSILTPGDAENIHNGHIYKITWEAQSADPESSITSDLYISEDGGKTFNKVANDLVDIFEFDWDIPEEKDVVDVVIRVEVSDEHDLKSETSVKIAVEHDEEVAAEDTTSDENNKDDSNDSSSDEESDSNNEETTAAEVVEPQEEVNTESTEDTNIQEGSGDPEGSEVPLQTNEEDDKTILPLAVDEEPEKELPAEDPSEEAIVSDESENIGEEIKETDEEKEEGLETDQSEEEETHDDGDAADDEIPVDEPAE